MELADILEVVYKIAALRRVDKEELESLRVDKLKERGGYQKNLFLVQTTER
jgi:predicted house-cleaning noncanonical NTP pyrophosphatase (MazG superfamily)